MTMKVDGSAKVQSNAPDAPAEGAYTVKSGDTLSAIAARHQIGLQKLIAANPQIKDPNLIFPGQEIHIPKKAAAEQAPAATGPEKRKPQDRSKRSIPPPAVNVGQLHDKVHSGGPGKDLVPNQFSLGGAVGSSACGPAALVALEKSRGKDISLSHAVDVAKGFGWNTAGGMNGFTNFEHMANAQGLHFNTGNTSDIRAQVEKGNPVVISTAQHYFVAQAFDPQSGKFFFGNSGTALRAGSQWLTLDQVASLGRGINGVGWAG